MLTFHFLFLHLNCQKILNIQEIIGNNIQEIIVFSIIGKKKNFFSEYAELMRVSSNGKVGLLQELALRFAGEIGQQVTTRTKYCGMFNYQHSKLRIIT